MAGGSKTKKNSQFRKYEKKKKKVYTGTAGYEIMLFRAGHCFFWKSRSGIVYELLLFFNVEIDDKSLRAKLNIIRVPYCVSIECVFNCTFRHYFITS